jgi:hypothetical protein
MAEQSTVTLAFERAWNVYLLINNEVNENDERRTTLERFIRKHCEAGESDPETLTVGGLTYLKKLDELEKFAPVRAAIRPRGRPARALMPGRRQLRLMLSGKNGTIDFLAGFAVGITKNLKEDTLKKLLMISATVFAVTTVAGTANAAEFYVVRDATTKKCTIVDTKPTTTTVTVVDNGTFKTRTEAETGMKTMKVCTAN